MNKPRKTKPNTRKKPIDELELSEGEVLEAISELFGKKKSDAALAHYPTLRIQTNNLHAALQKSISSTNAIVDRWAIKLEEDSHTDEDFRTSDSPLSPYRIIAPALVRNMHHTANFLLDETRIIPAVQSKDISKTIPSFSDFVRLGAAVRAFLDSLVQTSYQLTTFDGKQLNYKFLQSLISFAPVAPQSLKTNIASPKLQKILNSYASLETKQRKDSSFTKASNEQFPQRLEAVCQKVNCESKRRRNIELLFNFCSDFVHSGYVSVLALGEPGAGFIMGGPDDSFTPRAENFSELKQRLLVECANAYAEIFLPVLRKAINRTLIQDDQWKDLLNNSISVINESLAIIGRKLIEPVRKGALGSGEELSIDCMCGRSLNLSTIQHEWDHYCRFCGSRFKFCEVPEETDYIISSSGPGDVLGSDAKKIRHLDHSELSKLDRIFRKHSNKLSKEPVEFRLVDDLMRCNEDTLQTDSYVTHVPTDIEKETCDTFTWVATKSLERCAIIQITCICGKICNYQTSPKSSVCHCPRCNRNIGIFGISGNIEKLEIKNTDGSPGHIEVQARNRFIKPGTAT